MLQKIKQNHRTFLNVTLSLINWILVQTHSSILPYWACVTRFGKISPIGQNFSSLAKFLTVHFPFGKMLSLLWQICDIIGLVFIFANGQILKNNLAIWSHCYCGVISHSRKIWILFVPVEVTFHSTFQIRSKFWPRSPELARRTTFRSGPLLRARWLCR